MISIADREDSQLKKHVLSLQTEFSGLCRVEDKREEHLDGDWRDVLVKGSLVDFVIRTDQEMDSLDKSAGILPGRAEQNKNILELDRIIKDYFDCFENK